MENLSLRELHIVVKGTAICSWAMAHLKPAIPMKPGVLHAALTMGLDILIFNGGLKRYESSRT